jgi:hypothetical protein
MSELEKKLSQPIPCRWRVQSFSKNKPMASCVAYIDARDVMNRLDEVLEPQNWQSDYKEVAGHVVAGIGIKSGDSWVWKWDTGSESNTEKDKGLFSDSFKRAAVKWGVGRFLYELPIVYVDASATKTDGNYPYPIDKQGQRIWDMTKHVNEVLKAVKSSE